MGLEIFKKITVRDMILITGAGGFLGRELLTRLCSDGSFKSQIRCLIKRKEQEEYFSRYHVEVIVGDIRSEDVLSKALEGVYTVVHLAAKIKTLYDSDYYEVNLEGTKKLIQKCREQNAKRIIFMSTTQAREEFNTAYGKSKRLAEDVIRQSGLEWVIVRPVIFYGKSDDKDLMQLVNFIKLWPIVPIFGNGEYKLQPLHVEDLVEAVIRLIKQKDIKDITFEIGGGSVVTMNEFVDLVCKSLNLKRLKIHLPISLCKLFFKIQACISSKPLMNPGMFKYITYDKVCDNSWVQKYLNLYPMDLSSGIRKTLLLDH